MTRKETIVRALEQLPEPVLDEVIDFIEFLKRKAARERLATVLASESALRKDWLRPEEDEAWSDL